MKTSIKKICATVESFIKRGYVIILLLIIALIMVYSKYDKTLTENYTLKQSVESLTESNNEYKGLCTEYEESLKELNSEVQTKDSYINKLVDQSEKLEKKTKELEGKLTELENILEELK